MGSLSTKLPGSSAAAAAAAAANTTTTGPQWMLLAPYGGGIDKDCNVTGDSKTIAAAATSMGHGITVSLSREPSQGLSRSRICLRFRPATANTGTSAYSTVIAAHGGSVLLQITSRERYVNLFAFDYFIYNYTVAADPARPPSLHLLPAHPSTERHWWLDVCATGFLCRGEAEFVVAQLKMPLEALESEDDDADSIRRLPMRAELLLFCNRKWRVKRPFVIHSHGNDGDHQLLGKWKPHAVVPVGDGVLCWVDYYCGIILADVFDQTNVLWYVPYPATEYTRLYFVCTNSRGELKLVGISPRHCSHCGCSQHATAVDTWTLDTNSIPCWVLETETSMVDGDSTIWFTHLRAQTAAVAMLFQTRALLQHHWKKRMRT